MAQRDELDSTHDAWLETLLRDDAHTRSSITDAGFSARVLAELPPDRKRRYRWIVPAAAVLSTLLAIALVPGSKMLIEPLFEILSLHAISLTHAAALAVLVGVLYAISLTALWDER